MDALSVVLQLKRIAANRNPPPDILSKIPRLGVGLSYFLEHPDIGVQHEAAKALLLTCEFHKSIIVNTFEIKELKNNAELHVKSSDVFLRGICTKLLEILNEEECIINVEKQKPSTDGTSYSNTKNTAVVMMDERMEKKIALKTDSVKSGFMPCEKMQKINTFGNHKESICKDNKFAFGSSSSFCTSVKQQNSKVDIQAVEGELYTLVLALKKLDEEDIIGWASEDNFAKNLKQKIICIPGVVSVTVNIKKKRSYNKVNREENLNKNDVDKTLSNKKQSLEENTEHVADKPTETIEEKEEQKSSKLEVIAIVLIKLPLDKEKRSEILKNLKENYFVLNVQHMTKKNDKNVIINEASNSVVFHEDEGENIKESDLEEDELQNGDELNVNIPINNESPKYLDEEDEGRENVRMSNEILGHGSQTRWRFFSNPLFLGESRYLGGIVRSAEDPSLIEKLQKEKEAKELEKMKLKKQSTLDKVLEGISSVKFW